MDAIPDVGTSGAIILCSSSDEPDFVHYELKNDQKYKVPSTDKQGGKEMFCRTNHFLANEVQPLTGT